MLVKHRDLDAVLTIYLLNQFFFRILNIIKFLTYDNQTFKLLKKKHHILYMILLCLYHNLHILKFKLTKRLLNQHHRSPLRIV